MLPKPTGQQLPRPHWTTFVQEKELDYYDGPRLLLKRDTAGQDYLVLWNDSDQDTQRWIYLPLDPDGPGLSATPRLSETLSGRRSLLSALCNTNYVFIVDEDTATGAFIRTVKTQLHTLQTGDPLSENLPLPEARLNISARMIRIPG